MTSCISMLNFKLGWGNKTRTWINKHFSQVAMYFCPRVSREVLRLYTGRLTNKRKP